MMAEFKDPYDEMSDDQFDRYIAGLMRKPQMRSLNLKVSEEMIERTKRVAQARGVPYQTLIKALWEAGLERLDRKAS